MNEVCQFMYSRPFKRATSRHEEENEFASLWVERTLLRTAYQVKVLTVYGMAQFQRRIQIYLQANCYQYCRYVNNQCVTDPGILSRSDFLFSSGSKP